MLKHLTSATLLLVVVAGCAKTATQDAIAPHGEDAPFPRPDGLTDDEVVQVVDLARDAVRKARRGDSLRVVRITSWEPDRFVVMFGRQSGYLAGSGASVGVRRENGQFKVIGEVGVWMS